MKYQSDEAVIKAPARYTSVLVIFCNSDRRLAEELLLYLSEKRDLLTYTDHRPRVAAGMTDKVKFD